MSHNVHRPGVTVGVLMAITLVIAPAVTARLLGRSLDAMVLIAIGSGLVSGAVGLLVSYHAGLPAGPTIAIIAVSQVAIAALWDRPVRALQRTVVRDAENRAEPPAPVVEE